jgi:hypothetical protein
MKKPMNIKSSKVVNTHIVFISHWPYFPQDLQVTPFDGKQSFFLTSKLKVKKSDSFLFLKTHVGKNSLSKICKELKEGTSKIDARG